MEAFTKGALKHLRTDEGSYDFIGKRLEKLTNDKFIDEKMLPKFFQAYFKGTIDCSAISATLEAERREEIISQLIILADLIFGIEVKRNAAVLLMHAMYFDLVKALYSIITHPHTFTSDLLF